MNRAEWQLAGSVARVAENGDALLQLISRVGTGAANGTKVWATNGVLENNEAQRAALSDQADGQLPLGIQAFMCGFTRH